MIDKMFKKHCFLEIKGVDLSSGIRFTYENIFFRCLYAITLSQLFKYHLQKINFVV